MNYRRFVKTAKAVREKETPSFLDRLPQAEAAPMPLSRRRVTAFVCAAAVLAVVLYFGLAVRSDGFSSE